MRHGWQSRPQYIVPRLSKKEEKMQEKMADNVGRVAEWEN